MFRIRNFISGLQKEKPDMVKVLNIGRSYEKRMLPVVKISTVLTKDHAYNPGIFILAGMHSRDWVGVAMAAYMVRRLTADPVALDRELDGLDWYIMPVANPDGYEFSRRAKSNRLWKKTRSKGKKGCIGVDPDRNFGFHWDHNDLPDLPCDDGYSGTKPFSEKETIAIRDFLQEHKKYIKLFVSLNCYGQYLVYPWGYTTQTQAPSSRRLRNLANMVSDSVQTAGGPPFKVMSAGSRSEVTGSSMDYAFGDVGIPYAYSMDLTEGFDYTFPVELLKNVLYQYYEGFVTLATQMQKEFSEYYDDDDERS